MTIDQPGVCEKCGCTNDRACEGGCTWANAGRTLCSACAFPSEEYLLHQMVVEMSNMPPRITFDIETPALYAILSQLQHALADPDNDGEGAEIARGFIEQVRAQYFNTPALFETIRRGFVKAEPAIAVPERPSLILPENIF
jgi:hypothetical protein